MIPIRVIAIPTEIATSVRETHKDPHYGFPASRVTLEEAAPCRHCLRRIAAGEEAILFTLDAFEGTEKLPLPGPVYIHAEECARYPESGGYPEELRGGRTLNAYGRGRRLRSQEYSNGENIESKIQKVFAESDVDYVHVRSTDAGCYTFRIERVNETASD
jgi:hypothetical protein